MLTDNMVEYDRDEEREVEEVLDNETSEVDVEEPVEGSEDEGQVDTQEEGVEDADEQEAEDMEVVKLTYQDAEGNDVEGEYTPNQIVEAFKKAQDGEEALKVLNGVSPILARINESPLMQSILHYKEKYGYSDEHILKELPKTAEWAPKINAVDEEEPESDDIKDIINFHVQKALKEALTPVQQQQKALAEEKTFAEITNNNNKVYEKALNNLGISSAQLTEEDLVLIKKSFNDIYPGVDMRRLQLNAPQANVLIKDALGRKYGGKKAPVQKSAKVYNQAKKLPIHATVGGETVSPRSTGEGNPLIRPKTENSAERRSAEFRKFFG